MSVTHRPGSPAGLRDWSDRAQAMLDRSESNGLEWGPAPQDHFGWCAECEMVTTEGGACWWCAKSLPTGYPGTVLCCAGLWCPHTRAIRR
jgi:hypothetical protein